MITTLATSLIKETLHLFQTHSGLTSKNANDRKLVLTGHVPTVVADYLSEVSDADLLVDLKKATSFLFDPELSVGDKGGLIRAFSTWLAVDLGKVVDGFDRGFFMANTADRRVQAEKAVDLKGGFSRTLADVLATESPQELNEAVSDFLKRTVGSATIVVQTPIEIGVATKGDIRRTYAKTHKGSFVEFGVTPAIMGGMRVLVDGEVEDRSWFGKIRRIADLTQIINA